MQQPNHFTNSAWPPGEGEMSRRIGGFDWAATPLGPLENWPDRIRLPIEMMLASPLVSSVVCGPERLLIYNDAAARLYGARRSAALGRPFAESFPEGWATVRPLYERAFAGEAVHVPAQPLDTWGAGKPTEMFDAYLTPIRASDGTVLCVQMIGFEIGKKETERHREFLNNELVASRSRLADELAAAKRLQAISTGLISEQQPEALYEQVLDAAMALMKADAASVQILESGGRLRLLASRNFHPDSEAFWQWVDAGSKSTCGMGLETNSRVWVEDVEASPVMAGSQDLAEYRRSGLRSVQSTPLIGRNGRRLGMLSTHWREVRPPRSGDFDLFDVLSRQAADLIERGAAEAALRASEERFRSLFQASPAPFLIVRPDAPRFTISDVNDAYLAATMRTREQLIGRGIFEAFPDNPDDATIAGVSTLRASIERVLASRRPDTLPSLKYDIARPDGTFEERWWSPVNSPVLDRNGDVEAIIHNVNDVTQEHRAQAALRESEERLREFGEASSDVLWLRDAATLQWEYLTKAFDTIYGISRQQALAGDNLARWINLVVPEDREHALGNIARVRDGERVSFEFRIKRPSDGEVRWMRNTDFPIRNAGGKVVRIGGIGHDVTELRTAAALQALLAAELQHRVRNILASIRSIVNRPILNGGSAQDFQAHLSGRLAALARTQGLLTRSPGAAIDLETIIRDELLAQTASETQFTIAGPRLHLAPKAAEVLTLAIHELATNATKYGALARDGGRIRIEWWCAPRDGENWLTFTWSESGVTIDAEAGSRQGFGTELITRRVPYELHGTGKIDFTPDGTHAEFAFPLRGGASILEDGYRHDFVAG